MPFAPGAAPLLATTSSPVLWYLTRGSGVVSLVLLTAAMAFGLVTSLDWAWPRLPRFVTVALHRNVSFLALAFLAIHVASTVIDGYAPIGWVDSVVPFTSRYHPLTLGLGAISLDLLLALVLTSVMRSRLSFSSWKLVHWSAYSCWPIAILHGFLLGTDRNARWMWLVDIACLVIVGVLGAVRVAVRRPRASGHRPTNPAAIRSASHDLSGIRR